VNYYLKYIRQYGLDSGLIELPVTSEHAIAVKDLEQDHLDPFDRLIVGIAMIEPMKLLTVDPLATQNADLAVLA